MEKDNPKIIYLHAISRIQSRFATTLVTSRLENVAEVAKEAVFTVTLPNAAFISNFTMCVDGKTIVGEVKEKHEAKVQYERAKARGESAGHIAKAPRETNVFTISTNISAGGEASFNLTYQEILQRVHGVYKHVLNIQPGQIVDDLKVDVFITESNEITQVRVPKFGLKVGEKTNQELLTYPEEKDVKLECENTESMSNVHITYYPSVESQKRTSGESGTDGQFVVLYDVKREESGSELQVVNGYFVHFFAPTGIESAHKHVIFVLDRSGSMGGRKIQQTKDAMRAILRDLNENDRFNIITFDDKMDHWKKESVRATPAAINKAIANVDEINARGCTNIDQALKDALCMLITKGDDNVLKNSMVIFLTDGQPTSGECNNDKIRSNVKALNKNINVSIHCLGFGGDADYDLLKKLAIENQGLARKIYEDSDAALQLQGFYAEVSQLLLSNVTINYINEAVQPDSIVRDSNHNYYAGGEFVVVGKVAADSSSGDDFEMIDPDEVSSLTAEINAMGIDGKKKYRCGCIRRTCIRPPPKSQMLPLPPESVGGFVERMWAYLTIKQLLDKAKYEVIGNQSKALKQQALQLSLKYQFVTELTSMVVTQPQQEKEREMECAMQESEQVDQVLFGSRSGRMMMKSAKRLRTSVPAYGGSAMQYCAAPKMVSPPPGKVALSSASSCFGSGMIQKKCKMTSVKALQGVSLRRSRSRSRSSSPMFGGQEDSACASDDEVEESGALDLCSFDFMAEKKKKGTKGRSKQAKIDFQDINSELPRMSLKDVVDLDWKSIAPELTAMTINSLPMSILSAIPWDDVIKLLRTEVVAALTSAVLQAIPPTAWRHVTLEAWLAMKPQVLTTLPISALKNVPPPHWEKLSTANLAMFKKETLQSVNPLLLSKVI